jgi:hypothetical protein
MKLKEKIRSFAMGLTLAMKKTEEHSLTSLKTKDTDLTSLSTSPTEGRLADSLLRGVVDEEVQRLRWRNYKILKEVNKQRAWLNEKGELETHDDVEKLLNNVELDPYDDKKYSLQIYHEFKGSQLSVSDSIELLGLSEKEQNNELTDVRNDDGSTTILTLSANDMQKMKSLVKKNVDNLIIHKIRDVVPKYELKNFISKMLIRKYEKDDERLVEFHFNKDTLNKSITHTLFINYLLKAKSNDDLFKINEIEFNSRKTLGTFDFNYFSFNNIRYYKTVEHNNSVIIKFICDVEDWELDVVQDYIHEQLEKDYENKTPKIQR